MPREGGASSTPRPIVSIIAVSGILDQPPEPVIGRRRPPVGSHPPFSGAPLTIRYRSPGGRHLIILHDAAAYVTRLPRREAEKSEWQAAIEALLLVAESGDDVCPDRRHESIEPGPHSGV